MHASAKFKGRAKKKLQWENENFAEFTDSGF